MAKKEKTEALVPVEEQPYPVPENWRWVRMENLCIDQITDGTHKTPTYCDKEEGIPFVSAKDVTSGRICWDNIKYITKSLHEELYKRLSPCVDDILLAKNGTTGIAAIVEEDKVFDLYVTLALLRPNKDIVLPRYLLYVINSPVCKYQFDNHLTGIGVPNLHLRDIKAVSIPVPSIFEQQRIVDHIESLFAKLDEAKEKTQAVVDGFEDRKAAILHKAFTGELTEKWRIKHNISKETWGNLDLQSVCSMKITDGTHKTPTYCTKEEGVPFISAKDVTKGVICWDNIKYITLDLHEELYSRLAPQIDDVLLAKNGTTGVAAIVDVDFQFDIYVTLAVLRPQKSVIFPKYLLNIINSPICKRQFDDHLTGIGVPNLHLRDIKEVYIPVPFIDEQIEIVDCVERMLQNEKLAKESAEKLISQIDDMKKSILAKAFRGELGTNDPTEPPVELS